MPAIKSDRQKKSIGVFIIFAVIAAVCIAGLWLWNKNRQEPFQNKLSGKYQIPATKPHVIDYNKLEKDKLLDSLMQQRKKKYGIKKGLDIIAEPDESIKIGNVTITMQDIIDKIHLNRGEIVEKNIGAGSADYKKKDNAFGIYVVKTGDNIWNIHFRLLKDYFDYKGISLSPVSDEPDIAGFSSGIGKVLKFSENMVYIYNIKDNKIDADLNLISPLSKIVVYNMVQIFSMLDAVNYKDVNHIEFDGETLWIPSEK